MAADDRAHTHESYAFACLSCGFAWEQEFAIEHITDLGGQPAVRYLVDGRPVPSPLTHPSCPNCGGHRVRVLKAGTVAAVLPPEGPEEEPPLG
ncbi:hypothetical protein FH609_014090 [Streptomyces sp. 3MP-14]|uniref:Uncharacterized protein n=1 Tax=Streptomyces mimosae TaxID=2586635 RepID=A0A5N6A7H7_9ACTN|nr:MULTISPECIES: hypothetical protein [Streptomyces]KAB8164325.1 hypothetical protein FH607_016980 [Streptomyces mimosae]KAB8176602.1 hypothetical protein FH609_014090 [Streptomyces sp. 3MP-14]